MHETETPVRTSEMNQPPMRYAEKHNMKATSQQGFLRLGILALLGMALLAPVFLACCTMSFTRVTLDAYHPCCAPRCMTSGSPTQIDMNAPQPVQVLATISETFSAPLRVALHHSDMPQTATAFFDPLRSVELRI